MNRARRVVAPGILLLASLASACGGEHPGSAGEPTRSESVSLALPTDPAALAAALHVPADSLLPAGLEIYLRDAYDSARAIWQVELGRARNAADSLAEARVLMWLGLAGRKLGDYPASRQNGEASLLLKRQLGLDAELSQSFNALGLLDWNEGHLQNALVRFDSAMASARRNGDAAGLARATSNIPLVQTELGDFDGARRGFLAAYEAFRAINHQLGQGNALANLAMLEIRLGNPAAALPLLADAQRHYGGEYADAEANALGQRATAWSALGDLQRAITDADSGLAIARAAGLQQESAAALEVLADLHLKAGSPRLALRRLAEADSIDALLGLAVERGNNLRRSSEVLLELGEAPAAAAQAERALRAHQEVEARAEIVQDHLQLALSLWQSGEKARAGKEAEIGLQEAAAIGNPAAIHDAAAVAAQLALENGDARGALRYASQTPSSDATYDWALADLRAGALVALGRLEQARTEGVRAVASLERERSTLAVGPLRSAYFMSRAGPFSRLVAIHLALGDTAAAFRVAAGLPGRALAERLGGLADSAGPVGRTVESERLLLRIEALEQETMSLEPAPADAERRVSLVKALDATRVGFEEHLAHAALSPGDRQLGIGAVSLPPIQARLADDEAFLTFLSGPERLDLFVVRRNNVVQASAAVGARALAVRVRVARELLAGRPGLEAYTGMGELHQLLLRPVIDAGALKGVTQLLIVPHGSLTALPFAALRDQQTGRFLVEDYVVSYLPAAAALGDRGPAPLRTDERMTIFAPLPDSLPGTAREARAIGRLVPGARARLGRASSEPEVRRALESGGPVHLASHGSQNSQNPLFSRMIVGRRSGQGSGSDGRLEVHEILGMRTTSRLVFLSGCETGLASAGLEPFAQGIEEGSLAQAFLAAGAGTVVATLWRVGDAGAADLAERFYRQFGPEGGVSAAEALARSQREVIRARTGSGWAAYTVWGIGERKSGTTVRTTGNRP